MLFFFGRDSLPLAPGLPGSSFQGAQPEDSADGGAQETHHSQVIRQLAEITATYSNASHVGLVLAATKADDLQWLLDFVKERFVLECSRNWS